jgi:hypothetical protein
MTKWYPHPNELNDIANLKNASIFDYICIDELTTGPPKYMARGFDRAWQLLNHRFSEGVNGTSKLHRIFFAHQEVGMDFVMDQYNKERNAKKVWNL